LRYDQDFIEKVREANNIVDIISQYTELKGRGHQHLGLCPFPDHNEKTPSFSVSENKQLYHCFGCKKSGNVFTFLETYSGLSFVEALEYLARRAHIEMPTPKDNIAPGVAKAQKDKRHQMTRINRLAAVFYHQQLKQLPSGHKLRAYLQKRHLTDEIIEEFRLGYAPETWSSLADHMAQKRAPLPVADSIGLIRKNKNGGYFDMFRDRLMFPIFSIDSQVIGFGGRIIDQGQPKYINSVESDVFKKGQSFFGLDKTAKHIRSEDRVFVVEGYMDLLALYSHGVKNVVATLGTALTENHVRLIKRWTKNVVLLFDGDQAGQQASERSLANFFKHDLVPQIFVLPEGQDPDDFISAHGRDVFLQKTEKTEDLFLHQLRGLMLGYKGQPKDKIEIVDQLAPLIKSLNDQRLAQLYIEEVARHLGESPPKVLAWIRAGASPSRPQAQSNSGAPAEASKSAGVAVERLDLKGAQQDELALLGFGLKSLKYMNFLVEHQSADFISHSELKRLFEQVVSRYRQDPQHFDKLANLVVSQLKNPEKIVELINFSSANEGSEQDEEMLKDCLFRVKDRFLQRQASLLVSEMKIAPSDDKLERFVNIQNSRKALKELKNTPLGE
jgi:DNA primase